MWNVLFVTFLVTQASLLVNAQNPRDDFCRRYGHQTTVIDDKLYIDGGWVDFTTFKNDHKDTPNTWLGYHDLNNLTDSGWPQLSIDLNKDVRTIPSVAGGVLWGDSVNKKFFVFGGETMSGSPSDFHTLGYDVIYNKWEDRGVPKTSFNVSSYGAGVGVSEVGQGYFYGGWIKNSTMKGWSQPDTMSSQFYRYDYDADKLTVLNSPDTLGRAEGAMVWIPAGDVGLVIYFGGLIDSSRNGTRTPQPMNKIMIYDPATNSWFMQTADGEVPQARGQFCADVAWAPDRSSYNIYVWGGLSVPPPLVNATSFSDVYVLSIPSFKWVKMWPDHHGNATYTQGHYASSCNMVKSRSQMMVIGGKYPNAGDESICDLADNIWAQHDFWTGGQNNTVSDTYWAQYYPNYNASFVPKEVFAVVGGNQNGGATQNAPTNGYDQGTSGTAGLGVLLGRKYNPSKRSATRSIPSPSATGPPTSNPSHHSGLSGGAIAGIVVGAIAAIALIALVWFIISRRVHRRRKALRQSQVSGLSTVPSTFVASSPAFEHEHAKSPTQASIAHSYTTQPTEMPAEMGAYRSATHSPSPINPTPIEAAGWSPAQHRASLHSTVSHPSVTGSPAHATPPPTMHSHGASISPPTDHGWTYYPPPPER